MNLQPKIEAFLKSIDLEVIESSLNEKDSGMYEMKLVFFKKEPEEKQVKDKKPELPLLPLKSLLELAGPTYFLEVQRDKSSRD